MNGERVVCGYNLLSAKKPQVTSTRKQPQLCTFVQTMTMHSDKTTHQTTNNTKRKEEQINNVLLNTN